MRLQQSIYLLHTASINLGKPNLGQRLVDELASEPPEEDRLVQAQSLSMSLFA